MTQIHIKLVDPKDYAQFLLQYQSNVDFHHFYSALKYHQDGRLDNEAKLDIYEVVGNNSDCKYYCMVYIILDSSIKFLINTDSRDTEFLQNATIEMMKQLHPLLNKFSSFYSAYIREDIRGILQTYFDKNPTHPHFALNEPLYCFYSSNDQCKKLLEMKIELPNEYKFVELCDEDANQICDEQLSTNPGDEVFIAYRCRYFPAVGIVEKSPSKDTKNRLISYEHSDGIGALALLYCHKDHRGKGLASRVEEQLCVDNIKQGIRPYKGVSVNRPRVLQMSLKCGYWSYSVDHQQNNEVFYCTSWHKNSVECCKIYED